MSEWRFTKDHFSKDRIQSLLQSLINYLKNPLREIKHVPDWSWPELVIMQVLVTATTAAITGLVGRSFLGILSGLFITPILTALTIGISSLFFYYLFQVLAGQTLPFRRLVTVVFFANLPFFIFQILSSLIPPISLIGFAFSSIILIQGLIENFGLPRKLVIRVISVIYLAVFLVWIWGRWDSLQIESGWRSERLEAPEVKLGE